MTPEAKICHDSAYPLSRINTNIWLLKDKQEAKELELEEFYKRLTVIEEQNNKLKDHIDQLYILCKQLRNE